MFRKGFLSSAVALAALAVLPGCPAFTNTMKMVGVVRPPQIELPEVAPQDFELKLHVVDQLDPPADYLITYRRDGRCDFRVTMRTSRRLEASGTFEIPDDQVVALWNSLREARYDELDPRYPDDGIGPDKVLGIQAYSVRSNDLSKEVQTHCQRVPELEKVRALALSYLPARTMGGGGAPGTPAAAPVGTSRQIVGDVQTRIFYPADDPRLKDVPADRRQPFPSWYDAVNFGFSPAPGFEPWGRPE
jgi:hypothetical protein